MAARSAVHKWDRAKSDLTIADGRRQPAGREREQTSEVNRLEISRLGEKMRSARSRRAARSGQHRAYGTQKQPASRAMSRLVVLSNRRDSTALFGIKAVHVPRSAIPKRYASC